MEVFKEIVPLRAFLNHVKETGSTLGFVPTMGALHEGHLKLIREAKAQNSKVICSIFVNPTQFNNPQDLLKYPRNIEQDLNLLQGAECDIVFIPEAQEMYPNESPLSFDFKGLDAILEGKFRPGHFSGVGLVVSKLLNIVQPDYIYLGQKDFQQVQIIAKLVRDLNFNSKIVTVPTMREKDGLAMSSRNQRLNAEERMTALIFFQSLQAVKSLLLSGATFSDAFEMVEKKFQTIPNVKLEYLELADVENLKSLKSVDRQTKAVLLIAGYVGEVRLIDNLLIHED